MGKILYVALGEATHVQLQLKLPNVAEGFFGGNCLYLLRKHSAIKFMLLVGPQVVAFKGNKIKKHVCKMLRRFKKAKEQ